MSRGARQSAAYRLRLLARTLPFPVGGARFVPSNNNDVWRLPPGYLRVAWRGDRGRLAREAAILGALAGTVPVPEVLDLGGDERLSWSLTSAMPGTPLERAVHLARARRAARPGQGGGRPAAGAAPWPVPAELADRCATR